MLTVAEHFVLMCVFPPLRKKLFFLCFPSLHNNLKPSVQTHTHTGLSIVNTQMTATHFPTTIEPTSRPTCIASTVGK